MARRYFVQKKASGRQSSATPLIFEKLIWGTFVLILLVLVLSVFWRHNSTDETQDEAEIRNRITRQIPRAQLELPEKNLNVGQDQQQTLPSSLGAEPAPQPTAPATATGAPQATSSPQIGTAKGDAAAGSPQGTTVPAATENHKEAPAVSPDAPTSIAQPEIKTAPQTEAAADSAMARPATPPAPAPPTAAQAPYVVRVGAFKSQANAQEMCDRLKKLGYVTQIWEHSHGQLGRLFMVELAPFDSKSKALKAKAEVEKQENLKAALITRN